MVDRPRLFMLTASTILGILAALSATYGSADWRFGAMGLLFATFLNTSIIGYDLLTVSESGAKEESQ